MIKDQRAKTRIERWLDSCIEELTGAHVSFASRAGYMLLGGERPYFTNSYAPISHATPCGRLTPRWSVEISLIRQSLRGMRSMATLPGSKACVWVAPLLSLNSVS